MLNLESKIEDLENKIKEYQTNLNLLIANNSNDNNDQNILTLCSDYGFSIADILGAGLLLTFVFPLFSAFIESVITIGAGISASIAVLCMIADQNTDAIEVTEQESQKNKTELFLYYYNSDKINYVSSNFYSNLFCSLFSDNTPRYKRYNDIYNEYVNGEWKLVFTINIGSTNPLNYKKNWIFGKR